jgi:uncharacterized protein YdeI (YjbR/CyaY-like superfamily)
MKKATNVDAYIKNHIKQKDLIIKLREIIGRTELAETIKWGMPTYTSNGKNLLGIGAFKNHVGLWFFQGGLLNDNFNVLINAQEGTTKAMRQMRFEKLNEINEKIILEYIAQTIVIHKKGLVIKALRKTGRITMPEELLTSFKKSSKLETSFNKLTPGRKREYIEHIKSAKRDTTKLKRLEKIIPLILEKKGLNDRYKNC